MSKILATLAVVSLASVCVFGLECYSNLDCRCPGNQTQECLTNCSSLNSTAKCGSQQVCASAKLNFLQSPLVLIRKGCAEPGVCRFLNGTIPAQNVSASECKTCSTDRCNGVTLSPTPTGAPSGSTTPVPGASTSKKPPGNSGSATSSTSMGLVVAAVAFKLAI